MPSLGGWGLFLRVLLILLDYDRERSAACAEEDLMLQAARFVCRSKYGRCECRHASVLTRCNGSCQKWRLAPSTANLLSAVLLFFPYCLHSVVPLSASFGAKSHHISVTFQCGQNRTSGLFKPRSLSRTSSDLGWVTLEIGSCAVQTVTLLT